MTTSDQQRLDREASHPAQMKAHLRRRILNAGAVEDFDWWVAGAGADLVVSYGCPLERLVGILDDLIRRRGLPPSDRDHVAAPGGWLQTVLRRLAGEYGMKWPGENRRRNP